MEYSKFRLGCITLFAGIVHAFTLGPILSIGILAPNLAQILNRTSDAGTSDILYMFGLQYAIFCFVGIFVPKSRGRKFDIAVIALGFLMWFVAYLVVGLKHNEFDVFAGIIVTFGGLGAGTLYWYVYSELGKCFEMNRTLTKSMGKPDHDITLSKTIALGWVNLAPAIFTLVYPFVARAVRQAEWYPNIMILVGVGAGLLAISLVGFTLLLKHPKANISGKSEGRRSASVSQDMDNVSESKMLIQKDVSGGHVNRQEEEDWISKTNITLLPIIVGTVVFQFMFYTPYIYLGKSLSARNIDPSSADGVLISSMIGTGSVIGRVLCLAILTIATKWSCEKHEYSRLPTDSSSKGSRNDSTITTSLILLILASITLFAATLLWNSASNRESFIAFAIMYGVGTGAYFMCTFQCVMKLVVSDLNRLDQVLLTQTSSKATRVLSSSMFMGALAGATVIRYSAVSQLSVIQTMLIGLSAFVMGTTLLALAVSQCST